MTFKLKCDKCGTIESFDCSDLAWEIVEADEGKQGTRSHHEAVFEISCGKCGNDMKATFDCWEYPQGDVETEDARASGAELIENNCHLDVSFPDDSDYDE